MSVTPRTIVRIGTHNTVNSPEFAADSTAGSSTSVMKSDAANSGLTSNTPIFARASLPSISRRQSSPVWMYLSAQTSSRPLLRKGFKRINRQSTHFLSGSWLQPMNARSRTPYGHSNLTRRDHLPPSAHPAAAPTPE